jgi:DNA-binding response OmpR family regulator
MKRTLLLVDDDQSMIKLLTFVLKDEYEIIATQDPVKAIHIIKNIPIDGIITDISMPTMDGLTLLNITRNELKDEKTPIIVLSSKDSSTVKISCIMSGADDYLVKPFNPAELKARLSAIYRRMRAA